MKKLLLLLITWFLSLWINYSFANIDFVDDVNFGDDWSIDAFGTTIENNNVITWDAQITDQNTTTWNISINQWIETDVEPIKSSSTEIEPLNSAIDTEKPVLFNTTETNTKVNNENKKLGLTELPQTWPETVLLLLVSLIVTFLILSKSKNIKI